MKTCIDCKETKPPRFFYRNRGAKDGLQSRCKICDNRNRCYGKPRGDVRTSVEFHERDVREARRRASELAKREYVYDGVTGGPLIAGYVR